MKKSIVGALALLTLLSGCTLLDPEPDTEETPSDTAPPSTTTSTAVTTTLAETTTAAVATTVRPAATSGPAATTRPGTTRPASGATTTRLIPGTTSLTLPPGKPISLGQPFTLALGETGVNASLNLVVRFVELDDNRCPPNVQCVHAGNGRVWIDVTVALGGPKSRLVLNTTDGPKQAFLNNYRFELAALTPGSPAPLPEYRATLVVTAH